MLAYNGKPVQWEMRGLFGEEIRADSLPAGFAFHCDACKVVIPADAPRPAGGDCGWVARHRMAPFKPAETLAGQFAMAVAAWGMIYHAELKAATPHPEGAAYHHGFRHARKVHFAASAARQAMTQEEIDQDRTARQGRDAWLYRE